MIIIQFIDARLNRPYVGFGIFCKNNLWNTLCLLCGIADCVKFDTESWTINVKGSLNILGFFACRYSPRANWKCFAGILDRKFAFEDAHLPVDEQWYVSRLGKWECVGLRGRLVLEPGIATLGQVSNRTTRPLTGRSVTRKYTAGSEVQDRMLSTQIVGKLRSWKTSALLLSFPNYFPWPRVEQTCTSVTRERNLISVKLFRIGFSNCRQEALPERDVGQVFRKLKFTLKSIANAEIQYLSTITTSRIEVSLRF